MIKTVLIHAVRWPLDVMLAGKQMLDGDRSLEVVFNFAGPLVFGAFAAFLINPPANATAKIIRFYIGAGLSNQPWWMSKPLSPPAKPGGSMAEGGGPLAPHDYHQFSNETVPPLQYPFSKAHN